MAEIIGVSVTGAREVELEFDSMPQAMHARLLSRITFFIERLAGLVRAAVPRKTGKLASEIVSAVRDSADRITGEVSFSAEFAKAGALEYGGSGKTFEVGSHTMRLDHVFSQKLGAPTEVLVKAYRRPLGIIARRFERGSFDTMAPEIEAGLRGEVDDTISEVTK